MAWGKAAFIVILGIVIAIAVISMLDLSSLGSFFGIGGHTVPIHAVNNTTVMP
jgi:hypothetical protein